MQIDAHAGGVNDIAFAHPNKQLCVVTCGDDKIIKVIRSFDLWKICSDFCDKTTEERFDTGVGFNWKKTI